jgi:photosystem II PsbZ protein
MVAILQLLVSILILLSFALVVGVPVILVSPGEWEKSKGVVYTGAGLWFSWVFYYAGVQRSATLQGRANCAV